MKKQLTFLELFNALKKINQIYSDQSIYGFIFKLNKQGINDLSIFISNRNLICKNAFKIIKKFQKMINKNIPIERVLKSINFYGYEFDLKKNVFCPKIDTENLVYHSLEILNNANKLNVVELGSGSGAIICSITLKCLQTHSYFCYENNFKAYLNTKKNIKKYQLNIKCYFKNYLKSKNLKLLNKYDVFIINPPYIDIKDVNVENIVKKYDPKSAIYCKQDQYFYYVSLINYFINNHWKNKTILFEIGINQDVFLKGFLSKLGINNYQFFKDINNINRILVIKF